MSSKSFELNDCLKYSLEGIALADPTLSLIAEDNILFRKTDKDKVAIISGGGSGHEPTHAGYIGRGMLAAAVAGDIFASPSTKQILNAIKIVSQNSSGVLLVVKNYTGDVLHFGLAAERARSLGIDCRVVTVGDDVAVGRSKGGHVGRRALAGTVLVHKIVGAFAEEFSARYKLEGVEKVAHIVNKNLVTVGTSLSHCKVPGRKFDSHLGDEQLELGMGIHNEPGVEVLEPIPSSEELIEKYLLPKLLDPNDDERHFVDFKASDEIVLLVNNLGGVSNFMISAIAARTKEALYEGYGITAVKVLHGTLMTAFNGNGFSITLLNVTQCNRQLHEEFTEIDSVLSLLDAPTDAAAWPASHSKKEERPAVDRSLLESFGDSRPAGKFNFELFSAILNAGAAQVIKSEPHITHLDSLVGDGDCGHTLVSGMNAVLENLPRLKRDSLSQTLVQISTCIEESMGGTSGGLYSILISGLARGLIDVCKNPDDEVTADLFAKALKIALDTLYKYTGARPGDSTMIDALAPFVTQFYKENDFESAVKACEDGARSTAKLEAKFGRASYVGDSMDIPDPGAIGIMEFLKGVKDGLDENVL